ncbi:hypothetical protein S245_051623, partial [Arachis hypogaea]
RSEKQLSILFGVFRNFCGDFGFGSHLFVVLDLLFASLDGFWKILLTQAAFGERLGVWLALFPTVYLSARTTTALILIGGETMKPFFQIVCGLTCTSNPLTTVEWYLVFTPLSIVLSQLPNLNSIAGLSLIGVVKAITYSTMVWVLSVSQQRPPSISYEPLSSPSSSASLFLALNALGIVAFSFKGHNLALEIQ